MSSDDQRIHVFGDDKQEKQDVWKDLEIEKAETTQQEDTDDHPHQEWYDPPYDPAKLVALLERSETHAACVHAKAKGVAGYGFDLEPHESVESDTEPPGRDRLEEFWRDGRFTLGPDKRPATADDVLENAWDDYESTGYLTLEILVNSATGEPTGLAHVPSHTIRRRKEAPGYVQVDDGSIPVQYFGAAGDRYGENQTFVNGTNGEFGDNVAEAGGVDNVANELLLVGNYSALAPHYGTPDIIPALPTLVGDISARKYQTKFFENDGVPRFSVIVEGGELSDRAFNELKETLENLRLEENSHRGMLIEAVDVVDSTTGEESDVNIRIEPLTVGEQEEAGFIEYRQENEADIRKAHSVPPVILERTEGVNYANAKSQRTSFAQSTIKPRQEKLASRLYQVLHVQAFEIPEWDIVFNLHGGQNREREADISQTRVEAGVQGGMTVNEARAELGLDPIDGPVGDMLLSSLQNGSESPATGADVAQAVEQARSNERARTHGYSLTTRRDALENASQSMRKADFGQGDVVEYDTDGHLGVITARKSESFTVPVGDDDEREVEASSDSPVYVVARQTGGFGTFQSSDLSSGSIPDDEQGDTQEIVDHHKSADTAKAGWNTLPPGWSRLTLLDAWSSMNGQFNCGGGCCMGEIHDAEVCASMKDEVLGTTRWRGRF